MSRARYGSGRHRQAWIELVCPCCGLTVQARRTLPGLSLHVKAHFDNDGELCLCSDAVDTVVI